jgi:hypothetical protein
MTRLMNGINTTLDIGVGVEKMLEHIKKHLPKSLVTEEATLHQPGTRFDLWRRLDGNRRSIW